MKRRGRVRKLVLWTLSLLMAVVVGGAIAAYHYVTEGETLVALIRQEAPRFLPRCRVDLIEARIRPVAGQVLLHALSVGDAGPGGLASMAYLPYVQISYNPWAMFHGRFEPSQVTIPRPTIRLKRRADGTWNCQGLLADPWPGPTGGAIPAITVKDGTVELIGPGQDAPVFKVLTEVAVEVPAQANSGGPVPFELTAKGDLFERVHLRGVVDPAGRLILQPGELVRLNLSDSLRDRLPPEATAALGRLGLDAGEVDARWTALEVDPAAPCPVRCDGSARLRRGILKCPNLPFPISDVSVDAEIKDGIVTVTSAKGIDGATALAVRGRFALDDPAHAPFEVVAEARGLQLDGRLRAKTPVPHRDLWDLYFPEVARAPDASAGRINLALRAGRATAGAPVGLAADIELVDVAMRYKHFPYRVEHVRGWMHLTPERLTLEKVRTIVGNGALVVNGTVDDPGPDAVAALTFDVEALPVDDPLFLEALPKDVRKVVADFRPTGTVRGQARLVRRPDPARRDPMGKVTFDAAIDLNPGCSATWTGLKYPVRDLLGHLEIHPDLWTFTKMRGWNNQARIEIDGQVRKVGVDPKAEPGRRDLLKVAVRVEAKNLPFDHVLRDALPKPWDLTWETLNPTGASDIVATVEAEPGQKEHSRITIRPRPQTNVKLRFNPVAAAGGPPPAPLELRMDDVGGLFVYDTATEPPTTSMSDVSFTFQRAKVQFGQGSVDVRNSGQFQLGVSRLEVDGLLLDEGLRRMMPPVMATFARRLDDRKLTKLKGDLGLGWSGVPGESAWCTWDRGLVVLAGNKLEVGGRDIALDNIEGELRGVRGSFDGHDLKLFGGIELASVKILDQQLTKIDATMAVENGQASIDLTRGSLLGGALAGRVSTTLDVTPRYAVALAVQDASLKEYAKTLPGHQTFKGRVSGDIEVSGMGYDLRSLNGRAYARVLDGDLGTLPFVLQVFKKLSLAENAKSAFDTAEVTAKIANGETTLRPVHLTGNTISLQGDGTLDVRGILNLKLELLAGRDDFHIPLLSDVTRELSGLFGAIRVEGPISSPSFRVEPLPPLTSRLSNPRPRRPARDPAAEPARAASRRTGPPQ